MIETEDIYDSDIPDYSELTCTNLMIKLKIRLKKLSNHRNLEFYTNREQFDNIKKPFSKSPYHIEGKQVADNKYHILIEKNK